MHLDLQRLCSEAPKNTLLFQDVMRTIHSHYECMPCTFTTGCGTAREIRNPAGSNAASCLLLAFARRLGLDQETTLHLYGEHYRAVLDDPKGDAHANIRAFMSNGWQGVRLEENPLRLRGPG